MSSKLVAVAPGKRKRPDEIKEYFSRKMKWLSEKLGKVSDDQFAVLYALVVEFLSNGSEWCGPTDKTLGEVCGKSERTIRRITAGLKAAGHIDKKKQLGASQYSFIGLNEDRPYMAGMNETRPATYGTKTGNLMSEDRPPVGRTEPSLEPSLANGSALPSPCNSKAAASPEKRASKELRVAHEGQSSSFSPSPPSSAPPPPPRQDCADLLQDLANEIRAKTRDAQCRRSPTHAAKTLANMDAVRVTATQAAVETELAQHPLYGVLLDWPDLELHLADATAAERKQKGSGVALIVNRYKERMTA